MKTVYVPLICTMNFLCNILTFHPIADPDCGSGYDGVYCALPTLTLTANETLNDALISHHFCRMAPLMEFCVLIFRMSKLFIIAGN